MAYWENSRSGDLINLHVRPLSLRVLLSSLKFWHFSQNLLNLLICLNLKLQTFKKFAYLQTRTNFCCDICFSYAKIVKKLCRKNSSHTTNDLKFKSECKTLGGVCNNNYVKKDLQRCATKFSGYFYQAKDWKLHTFCHTFLPSLWHYSNTAKIK